MSYNQILSRVAINAINEILELAKESIDAKTPEDTRELIGNNEIEPAREKQVWVVAGEVINETSYAIYVEFWAFKWDEETPYNQRSGKKYKYQKPKWATFHIGVGAGMFARTIAETEDKADKIVENHLDSVIDEFNRWTY